MDAWIKSLVNEVGVLIVGFLVVVTEATEVVVEVIHSFVFWIDSDAIELLVIPATIDKCFLVLHLIKGNVGIVDNNLIVKLFLKKVVEVTCVYFIISFKILIGNCNVDWVTGYKWF